MEVAREVARAVEGDSAVDAVVDAVVGEEPYLHTREPVELSAMATTDRAERRRMTGTFPRRNAGG